MPAIPNPLVNPPVNPLVAAVEAPPIAEALGWLAPEKFGPGTPLIDVSQAVPGYAPDRRLTDYLARNLADPEWAVYTDIEGLNALRTALAVEMSETYGGRITPDQVMISAGCNQAFYLALTALAGAGDEVIMAAPWYFNHAMTAGMLGIKVVPLPCRPERGHVPDPAEAAALIGPHTRAIVLVTPNNPTGAIYPPPVMEAFFDLARHRRLALIVDETYRNFLPAGDAPPHGLFQRPDWRHTLVHLYSFSKVYALTGYRVGAVATGQRLIAEIAKVMDCLAICAPHIGQRAALFGLQHLADWRAEKKALMAERTAAFRAAMDKTGSGYEIVSMGAFFSYLRHPFDGEDARLTARRLARTGNLLCLPGTMFGPGQERMLRFAFANVESDQMTEIARRLKESAG